MTQLPGVDCSTWTFTVRPKLRIVGVIAGLRDRYPWRALRCQMTHPRIGPRRPRAPQAVRFGFVTATVVLGVMLPASFVYTMMALKSYEMELREASCGWEHQRRPRLITGDQLPTGMPLPTGTHPACEAREYGLVGGWDPSPEQ